MSETRYRRVLLVGLSIQLLALLGGFYVLYFCKSGGFPEHNISETAYWGTIGLLGFMFFGMALPSTVLAIMIGGVLIWLGLNWKKITFLWPIGFLLWGVYWVALTHLICTPPPD